MILQGCDVSLWNGRPDWPKAVAAGMKWVAVKVSQGAEIIDPQAVRNVEALRDLGVPVMPYHFLWEGRSALAQVDNLMAAVDRCGGWHGLLPPAIDVEGDARCRVSNPIGYIGTAMAMCALVQQRISACPTVYTYPSFNMVLGVGIKLGGVSRLWAASYGRTAPHFEGWDAPTFWQYTDQGSWPGIGDGLDLDCFMGTEDELRAMMIGAKREPLVVRTDGKIINCAPKWEHDERISVAAIPLLKALGLPQTPIPLAVHEHTGRAYLRELEPALAPWRVAYRDMPQGVRVYIKRAVQP